MVWNYGIWIMYLCVVLHGGLAELFGLELAPLLERLALLPHREHLVLGFHLGGMPGSIAIFVESLEIIINLSL